ncbi:DUF1330 domain-containing protein [Aestuariivirga sp.]|uniref:DUF1330 domain-containing protein n=1 Tax=Aestuariivirga sp. TaxID=2650926 RepID=UPI00359376A4
MPAYIIADVTVTDPEGYEAYRARVPAVIAAHGGRYLARGGAIMTLEGEWNLGRCVILEFPDMAHVKVFWESAEYAPLRAIRESCATSRLVAVEGYSPPSA